MTSGLFERDLIFVNISQYKKISVIVPTLNEGTCLPNCLKSIGSYPHVEIIVVDGGSDDSTPQIALNFGCRVFQTSPNRSRQMNLGAYQSTGSILIFLHADSCLPPNWVNEIMTSLDINNVVCGAFSLSISGSLKGLSWVERLANFRSRFFQTPYGDQAIFLTKTTFLELGGFPDIPIMEDFQFIRSAKKKGVIYISRLKVTTSERRWKKLGILSTTIVNQLIIIGFFLGVSPIKLKTFYGLKS